MAWASIGVAADYPNKAIRLVTGSAPAGGSDFVARTLAEKLQERFGQPVIVENRTPEQFAAYIRIETAKWAKVVKEGKNPGRVSASSVW